MFSDFLDLDNLYKKTPLQIAITIIDQIFFGYKADCETVSIFTLSILIVKLRLLFFLLET